VGFFLYAGPQVATHAAVLLFVISNRRGEAAGHCIEIRRGNVGQHSFSFSSLMAKVLAPVNRVKNSAVLSASLSP